VQSSKILSINKCCIAVSRDDIFYINIKSIAKNLLGPKGLITALGSGGLKGQILTFNASVLTVLTKGSSPVGHDFL
jgi:hypothetical protein